MSNDGWNPLDEEAPTHVVGDDEQMVKARRFHSVFANGTGQQILEEWEETILFQSFYNPNTHDAEIEKMSMVFQEGRKDLILQIRDYIRMAEEG